MISRRSSGLGPERIVQGRVRLVQQDVMAVSPELQEHIARARAVMRQAGSWKPGCWCRRACASWAAASSATPKAASTVFTRRWSRKPPANSKPRVPRCDQLHGIKVRCGNQGRIPSSEEDFPCFLSGNSLFQYAGNLIESPPILGSFRQHHTARRRTLRKFPCIFPC